MNPAYREVIAARAADRQGVFLATSARLGTAVQNVEKDFWVCWTLDVQFNGLERDGPRLLFKGGTSLSAFGLISRFSEDMDITVFRDDLGESVEVADLDALSGKQRRVRLDGIRAACQAYIAGPMAEQFRQVAASVKGDQRFEVSVDPDDRDGQTLLFWYPVATAPTDGYIRSAVKIECGAKSALDPHVAVSLSPYVSEDLPALNLEVANVTTVKPERTFWDKVIILHGLRQWHDRRGVLRQGGNRVSRHYYDIHQLMQSAAAGTWWSDQALALDCARHARLFFGSADLGLDTAASGTFTLTPGEGMREVLAKDYAAMSGMVFGYVPEYGAVLASVEKLERLVNMADKSH